MFDENREGGGKIWLAFDAIRGTLTQRPTLPSLKHTSHEHAHLHAYWILTMDGGPFGQLKQSVATGIIYSQGGYEEIN